jgi:hypothetical protein
MEDTKNGGCRKWRVLVEFSITLKDTSRSYRTPHQTLLECDYTMKIHTLVAPTYLTLAILIFGSIINALAQNTTSSAVKSAAPQVATQLSDGQIKVSSATMTYSTHQLATTFSSEHINVTVSSLTTIYSSFASQSSDGVVSPLDTLSPTPITTSNQVQTFSTINTEGLSIPSSSRELQTHRPPLWAPADKGT